MEIGKFIQSILAVLSVMVSCLASWGLFMVARFLGALSGTSLDLEFVAVKLVALSLGALSLLCFVMHLRSDRKIFFYLLMALLVISSGIVVFLADQLGLSYF